MKLVNKILWKNNKKSHFAGAFLGSLFGFILLLTCIQLYIDFKNILTAGDNLLQPEYLVINKKVSVFKALDTESFNFNENEIAEIKSQPFVKEIAPFVANTFKVKAFTRQSDNIPAFYTDLFFETIEDKFLDVKKTEWNWNSESPFVPVIIPKDYLNLYNFGFSGSQGLPKISEGMIGLVTFTLRIEGNNKEIEMPGKIIGFSNRVNSILVPYTFMRWANSVYGSNMLQKTQRLVVVTKNPSDPQIVKFMNDHQYETNTEKLKSSKVLLLLTIISTIVSGIAIIIVFLSFMNFILGFQLLIYRSAHKIKLLLELGYLHTRIRNLYLRYYLISMMIIIILSFIVVYLVKRMVTDYLATLQITGEEFIQPQVIFTGLGIVFILFIINFITLNLQLKNFGKKG